MALLCLCTVACSTCTVFCGVGGWRGGVEIMFVQFSSGVASKNLHSVCGFWPCWLIILHINGHFCYGQICSSLSRLKITKRGRNQLRTVSLSIAVQKCCEYLSTNSNGEMCHSPFTFHVLLILPPVIACANPIYLSLT